MSETEFVFRRRCRQQQPAMDFMWLNVRPEEESKELKNDFQYQNNPSVFFSQTLLKGTFIDD